MRKEHLPFTYLNLVRHLLDKKGRSILDVGCGQGDIMRIINKNRKFFVVGVDGFLSYLKVCKGRKVYNELLLSDVRFLPLRERSFDIVFCSQVIEHLSKKEGLRLIENLEEIARRQVIIATPVGFASPPHFDENPLQEHKSFWQPDEFKKRGYRVIGQGLHFVYGEKRPVYTLRYSLFRYILYLLSYLSGPIIYFLPGRAAHMICVKNL